MIKKIFVIGIPLLLLIGVLVVAIDGSAKKDDAPKTIEVTKGSIVDKALAVGRIEPTMEVAVKSKISGIVRDIFVEVGDQVNAGDPLFDIAPDPTPLEYTEAKRQVEMQQVGYDNAKREWERLNSLMEKNLVSQQDCDSKEAEFKQAGLRLQLAQEKLDLLESGHRTKDNPKRLVDNVIKSPISGTVLSRLVEEGDPVVPLTSYQAGTELMTLAQMDNLIFRGNVDEIDVGKLREGMTAELEIGALSTKTVTGRLIRISPKAHKEEGSTLFEVEVAIDSLAAGTFLRAGYSANAEIIIIKRDSILLVPERLVRTREDSTQFVEVQNGELIEERTIETGLSDGINIEITSGLEIGQMVVERPPREITPFD